MDLPFLSHGEASDPDSEPHFGWENCSSIENHHRNLASWEDSPGDFIFICLVVRKLVVFQTPWHLAMWGLWNLRFYPTELWCDFASQMRILGWWVSFFVEPKEEKFDLFLLLLLFFFLFFLGFNCHQIEWTEAGFSYFKHGSCWNVQYGVHFFYPVVHR